MIVRQKPSSLYQAPCSGASIALIGIDFRPETAEKIAPPCMARLDVDNCSRSKIGGAYFSDVTGSIQDPIAVPGPCEVTQF